MQGRLAIGRQRREGVAQLVRIGDEVVVLLLAVGIFDVEGRERADRLVGGRVAAAHAGQVRVGDAADRAAMLHQRQGPPPVGPLAMQERRKAAAIDARGWCREAEIREGRAQVDILDDLFDRAS